MSQYILATLTYEIKIPKNVDEKYNSSYKEELLDLMSKKVDVSCYNMLEYDNYYEFKVKENIFNSKNLIDFLKEQFEILNIEQENVILSDIENLNSYDEVINFAKSKPYENFQACEIREIVRGRWNSYFDFYNKSIVFFLDGKVELECYDRLFNYMKKLIIRNSTSEISRIVKIFLD